ncbi:hypothetical protein [Paenibacillus sp. YYML68]|uniref:hypothetical protein n=1 Tax=Paenibacillus sp. YYML68 TaxID=2909250 RepID=UPI0024922A7F|nr:hypothetical protein [Paenibacillus sp. YYML68]
MTIPMNWSPLDREIYELRDHVQLAKQQGGYSAAIEPLRILHAKMLEHGGYGVTELLRLPLYLQQAGKFVEALEEINRLTSRFTEPLSISVIVDKRRLMFQREKRFLEAIPDGVFSYFFEMLSLYQSAAENMKNMDYFYSEEGESIQLCEHFNNNAQFCLDKIQTMQSHEYIHDMLLKLLKKAKRTDLLDELTDLINYHLKDLHSFDVPLFDKQIRQILFR